MLGSHSLHQRNAADLLNRELVAVRKLPVGRDDHVQQGVADQRVAQQHDARQIRVGVQHQVCQTDRAVLRSRPAGAFHGLGRLVREELVRLVRLR